MALLPLSISLTGLRLGYPQDVSAATLREVLPWAATLGCRGVQLSATAQGLKPRELDRSARRDLAAVVRRTGLGISGVDCLVPPEHFVSPLYQDRAVDAVGAACQFASEMASLLASGYVSSAVTVLLHRDTPEEVLAAMAGHAENHGCVLCELNWPAHRSGAVGQVGGMAGGQLPPGQVSTAGPAGQDQFRVALDPAALLMGGLDPVAMAARAGRSLSHPRLSDVSTAGRVAAGSSDGRLDVLAYSVALSAAQYSGPVILDLRAVQDQMAAAATAAGAWLASAAELSQFH